MALGIRDVCGRGRVEFALEVAEPVDGEVSTAAKRLAVSGWIGLKAATRVPVAVPGGSVSFQGKWCKCQTDPYQRLYQAAEIRSRSAATRWTWMTRRRASEMVW